MKNKSFDEHKVAARRGRQVNYIFLHGNHEKKSIHEAPFGGVSIHGYTKSYLCMQRTCLETCDAGI